MAAVAPKRRCTWRIAAEERRAADEQHVRQHDGGELDRQQAVGRACPHEQRHARQDQLADDREREQDRAEQVDAGDGEVVAPRFGWLLLDLPARRAG